MTTSPVKLTKQWSLEGGRLSKPYGLEVKEIDTPAGTVCFVRLDKNADWLLKALFGHGAKGALRMSTLFNTLNTMITHAAADPASRWNPERSPESSSSSAVAEPGAIDPMSQLEEISSENATPKKRKGQGGKHYESKRGQNKIHTVTMPEHEPVSHPNKTEERNIRLLPTSTCSLWLCIEDIPWLVRWISDELRSGGVPLPKSDPLDALDCNCEAEHVHIRWDFSGAWEAMILEAAKRGHKTTCSVSNLNEDKWLAVGATERYGTVFGMASAEQKKEACFMYLEKHMKGVMGASHCYPGSGVLA